MSSRKKFFLIFLFIILDMFLIVGYLVVRDATMLTKLKKEVYELSKLDVTKDRYNLKNVTSGQYKVVEGAIKTYLDDYAVLLQNVMDSTQDEKLTKLLSYENYVEDAPEFKKSLAYLDSLNKDFNAKIDQLLLDLEEDTIKNYIYDKTDDAYFQDLYQELMLSDSMKEDFAGTKTLLQQTKERMNVIIENSTKLFNFLIANQEAWVLEEGEIRFQTEDLYNQYNAYIKVITGE